MLEDLEELANTLNDNDATWWPFLFLRPRKHERLDLLRTGALALLYGVFFGQAFNVIVKLTGEPPLFGHDFAFPAMFVLAMFIGFRFPLAWAWNRRAARLDRNVRWARHAAASLPAEDAERDDKAA